MKNYAVIFLVITLILTASAKLASAQDTIDSYFAGQVKLSKPSDFQAKPSVSENATAPTNDNFAAAETITLGGNGVVALTRNNISATKEAGEPNHAENAGGSSVWFTFTPPATTNYEISTVGAETNFDTTLAFYYGNNIQSLIRMGYNDDCYRSECGTKSRVRLYLAQGVAYRIAIDGYNNGVSTASGTFKLTIEQYNTPFAYDNLGGAYDLGTVNAASIAGTNYLATGQAGEPNHSGPGNEPGGKSVWYRFRVYSNRAMTVQTTHTFRSEIAVYESDVENPTFADLTRRDSNDDFLSSFTPGKNNLNFRAYASRYYFIAIDWNSEIAGDPTGNFQLKVFPTKLSYSMQLDNHDPMTHISVFRPSTGVWYSLPENNPFIPDYEKFGISGDTPFPADFDGDALTNYAVSRNQNGLKHWYIQTAAGNSYWHFQWGLATDKGVVGDFDRDGLADAGVIRAVGGSLVWYLRQSSNFSSREIVFGIPGDRTVLGDFDGDGATELAVVRAEADGLKWYMLMSNGNQSYTQMKVTHFGIASDSPAVEDFDGDGKSDIAVYRKSNGTWYILRSGSGELQITQFGSSNDHPQPGDYDADGKADLGLYRPSTGDWYLWLSKDNTQKVIHWGLSGDIPVTSMSRFSEPPMEK